jgi:NAD(P)-dependent dehydrogenase (short-subunit alcohol dehydrogenase family)
MFAAVAPQMRERRSGYVIQFSSSLGRIPAFAGVAVYNLSKAAIESMSDNMASSEAPFGIDVSVIQLAGPYPTRPQGNGQRYLTEMLDSLPAERRRHLAVFEQQIVQIRERLVGDRTLNSQEIADGALAMIRMAPGSRPRRQIIGPPREDPSMVNAAHDRAMNAQSAGRAQPASEPARQC